MMNTPQRIEPSSTPDQTIRSDRHEDDSPEEDVLLEHDIIPPIPTPAPGRSAREHRPVERYLPHSKACHDQSAYIKNCHEAMRSRAEPKSYKMAIKSKNAKAWREACDKEMANIMDMGVWEIVDHPENSPVVGAAGTSN